MLNGAEQQINSRLHRDKRQISQNVVFWICRPYHWEHEKGLLGWLIIHYSVHRYDIQYYPCICITLLSRGLLKLLGKWLAFCSSHVFLKKNLTDISVFPRYFKSSQQLLCTDHCAALAKRFPLEKFTLELQNSSGSGWLYVWGHFFFLLIVAANRFTVTTPK